jgi:hypothetical protein
MGDTEDKRIDLATVRTVTLSIIAIAAFVTTLACFVTSVALAEEVRRSGNYWHRVCASQDRADVLRCSAYLQGLDDVTGRRQRRTSLRRSPPINGCWQARGGRHEFRQSSNGTGNDVGFDRRKGLKKQGPDAFRDGIHVDRSIYVSDTVAAARLFHVPRWREAR